MEIPSWVSDGVYILQWSQIGGYNSQQDATKQLPIYHTCANIRISGGVPLTARPDDWIAPFYGGDMVGINGKQAQSDQCAFKKFNASLPTPPSSIPITTRPMTSNSAGPMAGPPSARPTPSAPIVSAFLAWVTSLVVTASILMMFQRCTKHPFASTARTYTHDDSSLILYSYFVRSLGL
jgi:hypothetical protein